MAPALWPFWLLLVPFAVPLAAELQGAEARIAAIFPADQRTSRGQVFICCVLAQLLLAEFQKRRRPNDTNPVDGGMLRVAQPAMLPYRSPAKQPKLLGEFGTIGPSRTRFSSAAATATGKNYRGSKWPSVRQSFHSEYIAQKNLFR